MRTILFFVCLTGLLFACYDDKGNYDYHDINQITISGIDSLIRCDQMDLLHIPVTLEGTQYADTNQFTYFWEINRKMVSTAKDLNVYVNFPLGENEARFVVTDKELGTKAFKYFKINVSSSTAGDGILVLSKYKGHAELSFKRLDKEGSVFTPNFYEALAGNYLGTNPRRIHRNYVPEADNENSGLKIETDHQIKCLSEETLQEIGENTILDHNFFIRRANSLPSGDITDFDVKAFAHQPVTMEGGFGKSTYIFTIAGDEFWMDQAMLISFGGMSQTMCMTYMQFKSPWGGRLSPAMFLSALVEKELQNYNTPTAMYMFDETVGQFCYNNLMGSNNVGVPALGTYSGYSLLFGTHTATKDHAVAVLSDGAGYRMLYMNLPNGEQSVLADLTVPSNIINETTSYYPMKNEAYMLFATNDKLYRYNLRELENNVAPGNSSVFVELSKWGYSAEAKITCMSVSRTEQEILLGVSRYGDDTEGMAEELKGDVLVLDLKTGELIKKYEGVSGVPVDVKIKYQKWLRDGKEGGSVADVLYF
ncbi:PKD-like family lipoprotein [Odoribacter sp. AF15-53]|uniref:PKD-like family lipoprotein n=1 Tax=Odoribacter sp. AF15-53 TaxID=2292236 RepID=UPI000E53F84A|nr:PKD-like family lipoprotein [Odoribacter sp. AF15-53]RHR79767.1 hypothetical protein DWW52_09350 [Odoribacter sp. AF15-53]